MKYTTLISSDILASILNSPDLIIIDCRFDLQKPEWGYETYKLSHIPGALYAHLNNDLSGPVKPHTGRHPLPEPKIFINKLSSWGITSDKQVVVYDTAGGSMASRLWWMLRVFGHKNVALLDGSYQNWLALNLPTNSNVEKSQPATFYGNFHPEMIVDAQEVEQIRLNPEYCLIDARSPERYRGEIETIDPIAGHIPGAVNRFHGDNLSPQGHFLSPEEIKNQFEKLLNGVPPERTIVYCGSGVTSCHHLLAMEYAGMPGARLYAGSWSEWIRDKNHPLAKGPSSV